MPTLSISGDTPIKGCRSSVSLLTGYPARMQNGPRALLPTRPLACLRTCAQIGVSLDGPAHPPGYRMEVKSGATGRHAQTFRAPGRQANRFSVSDTLPEADRLRRRIMQRWRPPTRSYADLRQGFARERPHHLARHPHPPA